MSSSLVGVLAQRLVRTLCSDCKVERRATPSELRFLGEAEATVYEANGCEKCGHSGYRGRTGIYEVVVIDEKMRQLIHDRVSEQEMTAYARTRTPGIRDDGKAKVLNWDDVRCRGIESYLGRLMAAFQYTALDAAGRQKKGVLEADSVRQIRQMLRDDGLVPLSVDVSPPSNRPARSARPADFPSALARDLSGLSIGLMFTRQLATLIAASLPIEEALGAIAKQAEKAGCSRSGPWRSQQGP